MNRKAWIVWGGGSLAAFVLWLFLDDVRAMLAQRAGVEGLPFVVKAETELATMVF